MLLVLVHTSKAALVREEKKKKNSQRPKVNETLKNSRHYTFLSLTILFFFFFLFEYCRSLLRQHRTIISQIKIYVYMYIYGGIVVRTVFEKVTWEVGAKGPIKVGEALASRELSALADVGRCTGGHPRRILAARRTESERGSTRDLFSVFVQLVIVYNTGARTFLITRGYPSCAEVQNGGWLELYLACPCRARLWPRRPPTSSVLIMGDTIFTMKFNRTYSVTKFTFITKFFFGNLGDEILYNILSICALI